MPSATMELFLPIYYDWPDKLRSVFVASVVSISGSMIILEYIWVESDPY